MSARFIFALVPALAAAACGQSQPTQPRQPIVVRSEAQDQLHKLDDMNRAIALKRAIYDSGSICKRVEQSGYVQEYRNLSMWTARCDNKRDWAIFIGPDGTAQVRLCRDLAEFGLPACFISKSKQRSG
jgi:hypothetical protein